jgi:hypothetical protein
MDKTDARLKDIPVGSLVRVMPASGLGVSGRLPSQFAYIQSVDGSIVYGMCCSNSLEPRRKRSAMDIAAEACGLKKVRVNGKVFYE